MKKQPVNDQQEKKTSVPSFATEAEEARWWHENRAAHGSQLVSAVRSGEAQRLNEREASAADRLIEKDRGAGDLTSHSRGGFGPGSKTGRTERIALPNLHQIPAA